MMDRIDFERICRLPIEGVAARLGLEVSRHKCLCPFHDDSHPSLSFHVPSNTFRCFACGASGGVVHLTMKVRNLHFADACRWLAASGNVPVTHDSTAIPSSVVPVRVLRRDPDIEWLESLVSNPRLNSEARQFLFAERRIDKRVVNWLGIGSIDTPQACWRYGRPYFEAPSLLFPYRSMDGRLENVQSRFLGYRANPGTSLTPPRFRFAPGGSCHIFNLPMLRYLRPSEPLFIAEGITDCMALLSAGHRAIAIPSATLLKDADIRQIAPVLTDRRTPLHIYPDADKAGDGLYHRLLAAATDLGLPLVRHDLPAGIKDFGQYWTTCNNL